MMKSIILCEGKTDLILFSYYLYKVCGWKSLDKKEHKADKKRLANRLSTMKTSYDNQAYSWYFNNDDILCIYAVGSNSLIVDGLQQIIDININTSSDNFEKIVVISDRDDEMTEEKIIRDIGDTFNANNIRFGQILHNQWNVSNEYMNMEEALKISLLPIIIPFEETGTIETFLLNCRKDINASEKLLVENCNSFVNEQDSNYYVHTQYLSQRGIKPKTKLGVYFAIVSPNRTYDEGSRILESVPWEEYVNFRDTFELLNGI